MKKAKIIVLAGQSNAVGVGWIRCLPNHFSAEKIREFESGYENVLINYYSHGKMSDGFIRTVPRCTEQNADTLGPEIGIADYLTKTHPDEVFYIVKWAFGCSTMCHDWISPSTDGYCKTASVSDKPDIVKAMRDGDLPQAGWCYNGLVSLLKSSIAELEGQGLDPDIVAFFWMQGETDACTEDCLAEYGLKFKNMITDFKNEFPAYTGNCTVVDAGISKVWQFQDEINNIKKDCAKSENHIFIDTVSHGLTTENEPPEAPDIYHYDVDSAIKLGNLFASSVSDNL